MIHSTVIHLYEEIFVLLIIIGICLLHEDCL